MQTILLISFEKFKIFEIKIFIEKKNIYIYLSKEVGKQYFRVTNDFYLMELTMMKGGARVRLDGIDYDEGWCASET